MSLITEGFFVSADDTVPLYGVSDLELYISDGIKTLYVASEASNAITAIDLTDPASPVIADVEPQTRNSGTEGLTDIVVVPLAEGDQIMTLGRYDDNFGLYDIADDGTLDFAYGYRFNDTLYARGFAGTATVVRGTTVLYTSQFDDTGFDVQSLEDPENPTFVRTYADFSNRPLADVGEFHATFLKGADRLFTAAQQESGVMAFTVRNNGALDETDRVMPRDANGFDTPTDIESVEIAERGFLLFASAGSDTITVVRISVGGIATFIDREEDTLNTRFEGVQDIEVFSTDDRTFVVAGGSDDGISLFELTYRGKLVHLETVRDQFTNGLDNVSSIEVDVVGETAYVYVGSTSENGVSQLIVDLSRSGEDIRGGPVPETLEGTNRDDVIWGMGRSDRLVGNRGDDRLIDGRGRDTLVGGPGADVFEFLPDGRTDWIEDFQRRLDFIDLTSFDRVYDESSILVAPRENGAIVKVGDDIIRLTNPDGGPFDVDKFREDMFIFG